MSCLTADMQPIGTKRLCSYAGVHTRHLFPKYCTPRNAHSIADSSFQRADLKPLGCYTPFKLLATSLFRRAFDIESTSYYHSKSSTPTPTTLLGYTLDSSAPPVYADVAFKERVKAKVDCLYLCSHLVLPH